MRKAQSWVFEYIISFLIFLGLLFLAFNILTDSGEGSDYYSVKKEADFVSEVLLSEGMPSDWDHLNFVLPGLLSDGRVDVYKLEELRRINYNRLKSGLGVTNEFVVFFENDSGLMDVNGCYWGFEINNCDDFLSQISYGDLSLTKRVVVLESQIVKMGVASWN